MIETVGLLLSGILFAAVGGLMAVLGLAGLLGVQPRRLRTRRPSTGLRVAWLAFGVAFLGLGIGGMFASLRPDTGLDATTTRVFLGAIGIGGAAMIVEQVRAAWTERRPLVVFGLIVIVLVFLALVAEALVPGIVLERE